MAENLFPQKLKLGLSLLLIIGGILMYVGWGIAYGSWNMFDKNYIGVYVIVVVLLALGVLGVLLSREAVPTKKK
ncbi:MAG: hypothetical protein WCK39_02115 [Methanomassiliicoccales archaeon]